MPNFASRFLHEYMDKGRILEVSRFAAVGILSTAVHYALYCLFLHGMSHNAAFTLGYALSFLCNYILSSRFTFRVGASLQRFVGFALSHATNYFIQMVLLNLFVGVGVPVPFAPLPVYAVAVPVNYLLVRFALTRRSQEGDGYRLFLLAAGFALLWLNLLDVPTLSDDMLYRFMWQADDGAPVETIGGWADLLRSQHTHYLCTNGRLMPHLLAQAFLAFLPPVAMQVADTLLFVVLIHLCVSWLGACGRQRLLAATAACTLLFAVFSGLRTAMLWGLGAANYLWTLVAVLSLLIFLRRSGGRRLTAAYVLLSPLALMAGWSHEALSLPVSAAFAAWLFAGRRACSLRHRTPNDQSPKRPNDQSPKRPNDQSPKRPNDHRVAPLYMLMFMAGTALCLLSPGIWTRAGDAANLQARLLSGVVNCVSNIRVMWLLAIALLIAWRRKGDTLRQHLKSHACEYVALAVATAIVLVCGVNLERVAFFADFIAMLLLLSLLLRCTAACGKVLPWIVAACCAVMALLYAPAYYVRSENATSWSMAEAQMREPGREIIAVQLPEKGRSKLMDSLRERYVNPWCTFGFYSSYMGFDASDVNMRCAARLYGKERLVFLPDDVVRRIESDSTAYTNYELDAGGDLYVWRMKDERPVTGVTFILNDEDPDTLLPHQRLVAYRGSEYELDDFHFEVVNVCSRQYLVFTKPTTNIYRRIKTIRAC